MESVVAVLVTFGLISIAYGKYVLIKDFKSQIFDPTIAVISYKVINETFLNYNLTILKINNVKVLCTLRIRRQVKGQMKPMLNWKQVDFCKFLEIYKKDKILRIIFSKIFQPTYIYSCPIKEGFYQIENAYLDADLVGLILPRGIYFSKLDVALMRDGMDKLISNQVKFLLA